MPKAAPTQPTSALPPGGPVVHPAAVLALLCASQLMVILDGSIVAVALPVIGADLKVDGPNLAWVVNAYLVPFGGLLLLAGRLGDILGPRRILLAGLIVFTAASLLCGLAQDILVLIIARFLQGVGGALASSVVLGMIITLFRDGNERGRALAVFSFIGAAGSSIGLLAGGLLTQTLGWPWIFLVNIPVGAVAIIGVRLLVPSPHGSGGRADALGAVLVTAGLMVLVYVLLSANAAPLAWPLTLLAAALLVGFIIRQHFAPQPLLPLHMLLTRAIGLGNLVQALMVAGLFGFQFLGILYLQQILGYNPLQAGLAFLPVPVVIAAVSLILTGRLIERAGLRPVLASGLALIAIGLAWLTRLPADGHYPTDVLPAGLLLAAGFGLAFPALAGLAVGSAALQDAGVASGLFNTAQQVGGALGLALLTRVGTGDGVSDTPLTLDGYHLAFTAAAALVTAALSLSLPATSKPRGAP